VLAFFWFNSELFMLFFAQEIAKTRKQRQFIELLANMLAYTRYLFRQVYIGFRFMVKGKIGAHGRTKTYYKIEGQFLQQFLFLPVHFYFVTTATYYGALGIRLWFVGQGRTPRSFLKL